MNQQRHCEVEGCTRRDHEAFGLCKLHYDRRRAGAKRPNVIRSKDLRPVNLDSVAVGWLVGVLEKLPSPKQDKP